LKQKRGTVRQRHAVQSGDKAGARFGPEVWVAVMDEARAVIIAGRANAETGERCASVLAEARAAVDRGPVEAVPVPLAPPRTQHH
jgi:hypothetical protein